MTGVKVYWAPHAAVAPRVPAFHHAPRGLSPHSIEHQAASAQPFTMLHVAPAPTQPRPLASHTSESPHTPFESLLWTAQLLLESSSTPLNTTALRALRIFRALRVLRAFQLSRVWAPLGKILQTMTRSVVPVASTHQLNCSYPRLLPYLSYLSYLPYQSETPTLPHGGTIPDMSTAVASQSRPLPSNHRSHLFPTSCVQQASRCLSSFLLSSLPYSARRSSAALDSHKPRCMPHTPTLHPTALTIHASERHTDTPDSLYTPRL